MLIEVDHKLQYSKSDDRLSETLKQNRQYEKYHLRYKRTVLLTPVLNIWDQNKDKCLIGPFGSCPVLLPHNELVCNNLGVIHRDPITLIQKSFIKSTHIFRFGVINADTDHEARHFFNIHIRLDNLGLMNHYGEA